MKTRKQILALLLAAIMIGAMFTGCGSDDDNPLADAPGLGVTLGSNKNTDTSEENTEATEENTEATQPSTSNTSVSLGRVIGNTYTNAYTGYGCNFDSSWTCLGAEDLQELPSNVEQLMEGGSADYAVIYDVMASDTEDSSVNVVYTQLSAAERLQVAGLDQEGIIDTTLTSKDILISTYEQMGMTNVTIEKKQISFLGETYYAIYTAANYMGMPYYVLQIQTFTSGNYYVTLTAACFNTDVTLDILSDFYKVN